MSCGGRDDRRLTFWDLSSFKPYRIIQATYEGELKAISIRQALDAQHVAVSDDAGEIKLFNFEDGKLLKLSNNGHAASVTAVTISPDGGKVISGDMYGGVIIWELQDYY